MFWLFNKKSHIYISFSLQVPNASILLEEPKGKVNHDLTVDDGNRKG